MQNRNNPSFETVLSVIESADDMQINQIIAAVNKRFQIHYPEWEVLYIACPKNDPAQRQKTLQKVCEYFDFKP